MDLVLLKIPWTFIRERCLLGWRGVLYGLDNALIDPTVPVHKAVDALGVGIDTNPLVLELACLESGEPVRAILEDLSAAEPVQAEEEIRDVWLFLVLDWIFEHRDKYADPLQEVEVVYADFGYPQQIEGFVRYMPSDGPDLGSKELNEIGLLGRWQQFVDEQRLRFHHPKAEG